MEWIRLTARRSGLISARSSFAFGTGVLADELAEEPHLLADNLFDPDAAQGLNAVSYQMQELVPLYFFT